MMNDASGTGMRRLRGLRCDRRHIAGVVVAKGSQNKTLWPRAREFQW